MRLKLDLLSDRLLPWSIVFGQKVPLASSTNIMSREPFWLSRLMILGGGK